MSMRSRLFGLVLIVVSMTGASGGIIGRIYGVGLTEDLLCDPCPPPSPAFPPFAQRRVKVQACLRSEALTAAGTSIATNRSAEKRSSSPLSSITRRSPSRSASSCGMTA